MQHGLAQGGEAGVGVLVGHVGLGGDLEDFAGLAFRGGDDDLESEARQHREGALRVTAVGLMSASSRNSVVYEARWSGRRRAGR